MSAANLAAHTHSPRINVSRIDATLRNPIDAYVARWESNGFEQETQPTGHLMAADAIVSDTVGNGQSFGNLQPFAVVRACIAQYGIYPSRS